MTLLNDDIKIKNRIFENMKIVMELEYKLNNVLGDKSKINVLKCLTIGSIIEESQKNLFKLIRKDIDELISDNSKYFYKLLLIRPYLS